MKKLLMSVFCSLAMAQGAFSGVSRSFAETLPPGIQLQNLATITNDRDPSVSTLSAMVDGRNEIEGLYFVTDKHDADPPTVTDRIFKLADIESPQGVVLDGDASHQVFVLQGSIDSAQGRGMLIVHFLYNGLFGTYHDCQVDMIRSPGNIWGLMNAYNGNPVSQIRATTWALGISTIENVCPK